MQAIRFSVVPAGALRDRTAPWTIFGDRPGDPDGLEGSALQGVALAPVAASPLAPMFEPVSLFGAHLAALPVEAMLARAGAGPVVVCIHGAGYEPRRWMEPRCRSDNPHRTIFHFEETPGGPGSAEERARATTPWFARALCPGGRGGAERAAGLAVGFAWASGGRGLGIRRGLLDRLGPRAVPPPLAAVYDDAERAGHGLAAVLVQLAARLDAAGGTDRPVHLFAHGMGARVAMSALAVLAARAPADRTLARVRRVLLLAGVCLWGQAAQALAGILFSEVTPRPVFHVVPGGRAGLAARFAACPTPAEARAQALADLSLEGEPAAALLSRGRGVGHGGRPPHALYDGFGPPYPDWVDLPAPRARPDPRGDDSALLARPANWAAWRALLAPGAAAAGLAGTAAGG